MLKLKQFTLLLLISLTLIGLNACNQLPIAKTQTTHKKQVCDENTPNYSVNVDKYDNAQMISYNIEITTSNVISKTSSLRQKLSEIKGGEIESFSSNENSANIRMYYPIQLSNKIDQVLSNDPEITNFSRSTSNIGQNYVNYAEKYYSYKVLLDNFNEIENIITVKSCDKVDTGVLKKMLEENTQNYKSNMSNYKKQMNALYVQIYIRKTT